MFCIRQDLDGLDMLREWVKKIQLTVGLLRLAAREGKVDHVKHDDLRRKLRLQPGLAHNWRAWRKAIRETPSNPC